jgi:hypothetical protein
VAWYHAITRPGAAVTASGAPVPPALTAAAAPPRGPQAQFLRHTDKWQNEVWGFYDNLGEFNYGVWWLSNMLSRVRLRAAKLQPDTDEPEIIDDGTAADLMNDFGGGVTGQAQIMKRLTVQLSVPGEGYLVGEEKNGQEQWMVRSVDEIRSQSNGYQVMDETSVNAGMDWRDLPTNSLVVRVWRPHDRYYHLADSPARSAREVMRELELVNRKITSEYLSRLASAGVFAVPDEISFPVREEFADAPNPFMAEWIETAAEAIKNPGTASAVIPIPLMGPAEALKEIRFIDFSTQADEKIIQKRESAIKRLATKLDMPAEILLGMGDVNHWGAWQLEEGALKAHIAPVAELICDSLTRGYLVPRLEASGEDPTDYVVWYDMSELALRPDRSESAVTAYDRLELSGAALRREIGFDEDDAPSDDELEQIGLKLLLRNVPNAAVSALNTLVGKDVLEPTTTAPPGAGSQSAESPPATGTAPEQSPPATQGAPPPAPGESARPVRAARAPVEAFVPSADSPRDAALRARLLAQRTTQHAVRFLASGRWEVMHPTLCAGHEDTCPYTSAINSATSVIRPGMSGTYLCHLDPFGRYTIDGRAPYLDTTSMTTTPGTPVNLRRRNGVHAST